MNYIILKSEFGAAFVALGSAFMLLSTEVAFACHEVGNPSVAGAPGSAACGGGAVGAPEISATGSLAAVAAVCAIAMLVRERRKLS